MVGKRESNGPNEKKGPLSGSRTNIFLGVMAMMILFGTLGALVYNAMNTQSTDVLTVNGKEYDWNTICDEFDLTRVDGHEGVLLIDVLIDSGVKDPEGKNFRFIGADGYQKEVPWEDVQNGVLDREEKKAILPNLAKAFWVRDLVEIQVV